MREEKLAQKNEGTKDRDGSRSRFDGLAYDPVPSAMSRSPKTGHGEKVITRSNKALCKDRLTNG